MKLRITEAAIEAGYQSQQCATSTVVRIILEAALPHIVVDITAPNAFVDRDEIHRVISAVLGKPGHNLLPDSSKAMNLTNAVVDSLNAPPPAAPDGWLLVPKEPTEEMTSAAMGDFDTPFYADLERIYRSMVAAAPALTAQDGTR